MPSDRDGVSLTSAICIAAGLAGMACALLHGLGFLDGMILIGSGILFVYGCKEL